MVTPRRPPGTSPFDAPDAPDARDARDARVDSMQLWEQRRAGGRASFIWRYGVLGWGLPAALITVAYAVINEHGLAWEGPFTTKLRVGIALAVIVFPAIGHLMGRRIWASGEARYQRLASERKDQPPA